MRGKSKIKKLFEVFSKPGITYDQDGLTIVHNTGFMQEPDFKKAELDGSATGSWANIHWRVHVILWTADHCKGIDGDFVVCGTNKGGYARAIVEYLNFNSLNKKFYLLDTFEGLAEELLTDAEKAAGKIEHFHKEYSYSYEQVKRTFEPYPNVKLIKGVVPSTLIEVKSEKLSFLSIDMNSLKPEIAALDYFWDKVSKGGMIVLDDYAYVTCNLQYEADNN